MFGRHLRLCLAELFQSKTKRSGNEEACRIVSVVMRALKACLRSLRRQALLTRMESGKSIVVSFPAFRKNDCHRADTVRISNRVVGSGSVRRASVCALVMIVITSSSG